MSIQKAARNSEIRALAAAGVTSPELQVRFSLDPSTIRNIILHGKRDAAVSALYRTGVPVEEIARKMRLSWRSTLTVLRLQGLVQAGEHVLPPGAADLCRIAHTAGVAWSPRDDLRLRELWDAVDAAGLPKWSASSIGKQIGRTKGSVLSRSRRLALVLRDIPVSAHAEPRDRVEREAAWVAPRAASRPPPVSTLPPLPSTARDALETVAHVDLDPVPVLELPDAQASDLAPEPVEPVEPVEAVVARAPARKKPVSVWHAPKPVRRPSGWPRPDSEAALGGIVQWTGVREHVWAARASRACCWPSGSGSDLNFRCEELTTAPGEPYCLAHRTLAYEPRKPRLIRVASVAGLG